MSKLIDYSKPCKYTTLSKTLANARSISCEFDKHGSQCQHGDCTCECHTKDRNCLP